VGFSYENTFERLTLQFNIEVVYLSAWAACILIHAYIWKINFESILKQIK